MKKDERNKMLQRYTDLLNRVDTLQFILKNVEGYEEGDLVAIIQETEAELAKIKNLKDNKRQYIFNFRSGGWNSEFAFTEEEALQQAIEKYGKPNASGGVLNIDERSFRVSTPTDYQSLMSSFY
jgi:predicted HNH restriction endonuclease